MQQIQHSRSAIDETRITSVKYTHVNGLRKIGIQDTNLVNTRTMYGMG